MDADSSTGKLSEPEAAEPAMEPAHPSPAPAAPAEESASPSPEVAAPAEEPAAAPPEPASPARVPAAAAEAVAAPAEEPTVPADEPAATPPEPAAPTADAVLAAEPPPAPTVGQIVEPQIEDAVEVEPELIHRPLPPSLRPTTAKDATTDPLGITANLPPAAWPPKVVADLMTRKIITVRHDEPIGELDAWMERFRFRHLPVVAEGMKLVGLITRTDLLHAKLGTKPDGTAVPPVDAHTPAETIMRMNVVVARLDSPLSTACRVMFDNQLSCLPVALDDGTLVGILTMTDFLKVVLALFQG
jgi:CBS domain-containing protein